MKPRVLAMTPVCGKLDSLKSALLNSKCVFLLNDSLIGPFVDFTHACDPYGITAVAAAPYHILSWGVVYGRVTFPLLARLFGKTPFYCGKAGSMVLYENSIHLLFMRDDKLRPRWRCRAYANDLSKTEAIINRPLQALALDKKLTLPFYKHKPAGGSVGGS